MSEYWLNLNVPPEGDSILNPSHAHYRVGMLAMLSWHISHAFLRAFSCWMVFKPLLYILVCCAPGSSQLPFRHFETWSKAKITKEVRASQRYQRPYLGGMCCIYCQGQSWAALWAVVTTDVFRLFQGAIPTKNPDSSWFKVGHVGTPRMAAYNQRTILVGVVRIDGVCHPDMKCA